MAYFKSWRINCTATRGSSNIQTREIEFTGVDITGATRFSNGDNPSFPVANAFDGSTASVWLSNNSLPHIVGVITSSSQEATGLRVNAYNSTEDMRDFTVEGSDDTTDGIDGTWTVVSTVTGKTDWVNGWNDLDLPKEPRPLHFHRVTELPATPAASSVYVVKALDAGDQTRAAWRVRITRAYAATLVLNEITFDGWDVGVAATPFGNSTSGNEWAVFDQDPGTSCSDSTPVGQDLILGMVARNAGQYTAITGVTINNDGSGNIDPANFVVEGSNDTTDGIDGTWTEVGSFTGVDTWVADTGRAFTTEEIGEQVADLYFTDFLGTSTRKVISYSDVDTKIDNALSLYSDAVAVADIAARDALTMSSDGVVLVADASADATVTSGAAMYYYKQSADTWTKTYEFEGMDIVFDWANISGKPSSSAAAIDQMVTDSHTHANSTVLAAIGEDGITNNMTFNSQELSGNPVVLTEEW